MIDPAKKPLPRLLLPEVVLIVFGAFTLFIWGTVSFTNSSFFCGHTCHAMADYNTLWQGSPHRDVPCVTCHDGGGSSFLARRATGIYQVIGYLARSKGERMPPPLSDRVCLDGGCHDQRLLVSLAKVKWTRVPFDHQPHLQESRRGLILRCTTCHGREAMGLSVSADREPCFLCHRPDPEGRGGDHECLVCHPLDTLSPGPGLLHRRIPSENAPTCRRCHPRLTWWRGEPDPRVCTPCHQGYPDPAGRKTPEELHLTHVTTHQIPCNACHPRTWHGEKKETRP